MAKMRKGWRIIVAKMQHRVKDIKQTKRKLTLIHNTIMPSVHPTKDDSRPVFGTTTLATTGWAS